VALSDAAVRLFVRFTSTDLESQRVAISVGDLAMAFTRCSVLQSIATGGRGQLYCLNPSGGDTTATFTTFYKIT